MSFAAAFFFARSSFSRVRRASTAAWSACASHTASPNHAPPRKCPWFCSNARIWSAHRDHEPSVYCPVSRPSFVPPAVRSADASSTMRHPSSVSGSSTGVSSIMTEPPRPLLVLIGVYGATFFWPLSAIAAHHTPRFGRRRKARICGFSPLLQFA